MSTPRRHHYLPQFYQRRWLTEGSVVVYRKFAGNLSILRKSPASVGFLTDLYANPTDPDAQRRQILETRVFSRIDNDAAAALLAMERERKPPSDDLQRSAWARFLMSLMHRAPSRVEDLRNAVHAQKTEIIAKLRPKHPETEGMTDDEIFDDALADRSYVELVNNLVHSDAIGSHIVGMRWSIFQLKLGYFDLLTSDRPMVRHHAMKDDDAFLILPIAPNRFFLATNASAIAEYFSQIDSRGLTAMLNDMVVRQAEQLVISSNEKQTRFIDNRFLRNRVNRDQFGEVTWRFA